MEERSRPLDSLILLLRSPALLVPAPHRDELRMILKSCWIRVWITEEGGLPIAEPASRRVLVGLPFLERLWAYTYAELAMLEWDEQRGHPPSVGAFFDDPATGSARDLLAWATLGERIGRSRPWPPELPRPPAARGTMAVSYSNALAMLDPSLAATFEGRVTRMFLNAAGWMLLHEIAHLIFGHSASGEDGSNGGPHSLMQEQEADHFASMWSLGQIVAGSEPDRERVLGAVVALSALVSMYLEPIYRVLPPEQKTHADAPTRLRRFLLTPVGDRRGLWRAGDEAWRAASVLVELHLRAQRLRAPRRVALGTDEHLCRTFKAMGGRVIPAGGKKGNRRAKALRLKRDR